MEADASPLPKDETTPPVTKMYFTMNNPFLIHVNSVLSVMSVTSVKFVNGPNGPNALTFNVF